MSKKLSYIDALRGLAIFGVLLIHVGQLVPGLPVILKSITSQGGTGVQLFFLISSFTLFLSNNFRKKIEIHPTLNFFIRRFFRIAPLFYLSILFYLFKDGFGPRYWLGDAPKITVMNILATFLFANGWYPYWINSVVPVGWSVAVEMSFYLIVPVFFKYIRNLKQAMALLVFSLLVSFLSNKYLSNLNIITDKRLWKDFLFFWFPNQFPIFVMGIVLFFIVKKEYLSNKKSISYLFIIISLLIIITVSIFKVNFDFIVFGFAFLVLAYGLSIFQSKLLVNKFFINLGEISFSIYLVHYALVQISNYIVNRLFVPFLGSYPVIHFFILFLLSFIITIYISKITHKLIELPGIGIGKKVINKIETNVNTNNKEFKKENVI